MEQIYGGEPRAKNIKPKRGLSIIELVVVMAILAVLVAMELPKFLGYTQQAKLTRLINDGKVLEDATARYYMNHETWPKEGGEAAEPLIKTNSIAIF
jgi:prepilin-type N-terminal cleavage/methylation domain-containing protein